MSSRLDEALKEKYRINGIHDPLAYVKYAIDWTVFPELLKDLNRSGTDPLAVQRRSSSIFPPIEMHSDHVFFTDVPLKQNAHARI